MFKWLETTDTVFKTAVKIQMFNYEKGDKPWIEKTDKSQIRGKY